MISAKFEADASGFSKNRVGIYHKENGSNRFYILFWFNHMISKDMILWYYEVRHFTDLADQ